MQKSPSFKRITTILMAVILTFSFSIISNNTEVKAAGTSYYVSTTNGDDNSYDGKSTSKPFKTLQKAHSVTNPGDTVYIMNGTYKVADGSGQDVLKITRSGNASGYITYTKYPGHSPVLYVQKEAKSWNAIVIESASYIIIDGLELRGDNDRITLAEGEAVHDHYAYYAERNEYHNINWSYVATTNTNGIFLKGNKDTMVGTHHIIVRNCNVSKFPGAGIGSEIVDYITIENNTSHSNSWYTIYATSGISVFHPYNYDESTGYKLFVRNNIAHNNETKVKWADKKKYSDGNGIIIDDTKNSQIGKPAYKGKTLVENNIAYNNGGSGIQAFSCENVDIVNNTAYNNSKSPHLDYYNLGSAWSKNCRVYNNVSYVRTGEPTNSKSLNENVLFDCNIYYNGLTPEVMGPNDIIVDPKFVNAGAADFRLQSDSPAIDSGTSFLAASKDFAGTTRPQGSGIDRGAYEVIPPIPPVGSGDGLTGHYYDNIDFSNLKFTKTDTTINFNWGTGSPDSTIGGDTFSIRWTGKIKPPTTGSYTFYVNSNDGNRLWVNGQQLTNRWTDGAAENSGTITLTGGQSYDITLEVYENLNSTNCQLSWSGPNISKQIIPKEYLYTNSTGTNVVKNGEFDNGMTDWWTWVDSTASATGSVVTGAGLSGTNSFKFTVPNGSNANWKIQLAQSAVGADSTKSYTLSFKSKAAANKTITVVIQQNGGTNTRYMEKTFNLTTSTQTFTHTFTPSATDSTANLVFMIGGSNTDIWMDEVTLTR